jgi:hypothetical protein
MSNYILKAAMTKPTDEHDATCRGCYPEERKGNPYIKGIRYKCAVRENFNLCEECEAKGIHSEHPMLKIRNPLVKVIKVTCEFETKDPIMESAKEFLKDC